MTKRPKKKTKPQATNNELTVNFTTHKKLRWPNNNSNLRCVANKKRKPTIKENTHTQKNENKIKKTQIK